MFNIYLIQILSHFQSTFQYIDLAVVLGLTGSFLSISILSSSPNQSIHYGNQTNIRFNFNSSTVQSSIERDKSTQTRFPHQSYPQRNPKTEINTLHSIPSRRWFQILSRLTSAKLASNSPPPSPNLSHIIYQTNRFKLPPTRFCSFVTSTVYSSRSLRREDVWGSCNELIDFGVFSS